MPWLIKRQVKGAGIATINLLQCKQASRKTIVLIIKFVKLWSKQSPPKRLNTKRSFWLTVRLFENVLLPL
jgi:hypothetical protein